ncbi:class I SAM-dependent methyltransferase [Roseinatronobacter bogoriensis]|uniref:Class I SAM-dependent methyltransferase n=1 Tax=Roseinatronobacter bogoriensis subsp. barguzinensis TaxID=441209 RepID=A0A2K8KEF3_9RHOB|nr:MULTISPECIES: class I SAM-dependent methyltransferase [Rhodobaca]ATX66125.1 class I SAM-dependent methyltransferase [Rhodobaca barguzinensis]MBB4207156.1 trans-aconitate methyltransferase [Rhodobaca bogoriensis DSM 18756]TDW40474.1 methyltransferase family protein [Rhodobaca barguzinensis]TDY70374.1 methyltransferase family protein [Rhodobaca bogoriensis DSM 18756]
MSDLTPDEAFLTLYSDLAREGPGAAADLGWALSVAATPAEARICDAGCGSGADTVTLAKERPRAKIDAVDKTAQFVDAARKRTAPFGARVRVWQGDMAQLDGPYDLIWCAGAIYFLGVTQGLQAWRSALAPNGVVAFSEPCMLPRPSDAARAFWSVEYPQITDMAGIRARVAAAGYRVLGENLQIGAAWENYYLPMERRIASLRPDASSTLAAALDTAEAEIARWRAAPSEIAYALMVVAPGLSAPDD